MTKDKYDCIADNVHSSNPFCERYYRKVWLLKMVGYLLLFCFSMRHVFSKIVQNRMEKGKKEKKGVPLMEFMYLV